GTNASSVVFVNSTQLTAIAPAHAAGTVNVVVTNPGGASATLSNGYTYVTGFAVASISPGTGPTSGGTAVTISGSGFQSGAQVHFLSPTSPSGSAATNVVFVNSTQLTAVTPAFPADSADVRVTNPGGATATQLDGFTFVSNLTITSVSPSSGTTAGGTSVTINGTGFLSGPTVSFGGVNATSVVFVSATQVTAVTPAHAAGPVDVRVLNAISGDSAIRPSGFTYTAPPVVTSVSPANGSPDGGNVVIINGSALQSGATVTFGGSPATGVTFISSTQLQVTTPAHAAGAVTVQVTNPNGQSGSKSNAFTYNSSMSVTSISPAGGVSAGGESVTVSGSGFQPNTTVFFDQDSAQSVNLVSSSQIQAVTPPHSTGVVDINVATPDSQFDALVGAFEYSTGKSQTVTPTVASVSPNSGIQNGGTAVTLTGTNFAPGLTVTFDGITASAVNVVSGGQITCSTPAHAAGAVDIVVTNPDGGTGTLASSYNYLGLDLVTITPTAANIAGGTVITLNGTGFQNGASVLMGGLLAATTFINSTQIQATAPSHAAGVVDVKVTNPDTVNDTLLASLTYTNPPGISGLIPDSGLNTGGTAVIIQGIGFQSGATVSFGSLPATSVTFVSSSEVRAVTPAQAVGTVDVRVNNPDGGIAARSNGFRYGQVLFQDGFESGSLSNFNYFQTADRVTINTNASFVRNGTKSVQIRYDVCGDSTNVACGAAHQDKNRYVSKEFTAGLSRFNIRGNVYLKTPEPGASADMQRKLLYIKAATGPSGTPNNLWSIVLTMDSAKNGLRVSYNPQTGTAASVSLYGNDNELGNKSSLVNGIFELQFDRWYLVEMEVQLKSALGAKDARVLVYIDGNLVFRHTIFTNGTAGTCPGRTYACPAFPLDAVFDSGKITRIEIGNQADRVNFLVMDELRFWDDIVIGDAYVGP
ncbi:MAG: beta strand repeat-containing protein, partial [Terriglobales bacterium]